VGTENVNFRRIVFLTDDFELEKKLVSAFVESDYIPLRGHKSALGIFVRAQFGILILDEQLFVNQADYGTTYSNLQNVYEQALGLNPKLITIILMQRDSSLLKVFKRKSDLVLFMSRDNVIQSEMHFIEALFKRQTFRTILCRDLDPQHRYSVPLFHYRPKLGEYIKLIDAGGEITKEKLKKLKQMKVTHLYVKSRDLFSLLEEQHRKNHVTLSEQLHLIRKEIKVLLAKMFDTSTDGKISNGRKIYQEALKIVEGITPLKQKFESPYACLTELPYHRENLLSQCFNGMVYSQVFGEVLNFDDVAIQELCIASLFHTIGLARSSYGKFYEDEIHTSEERVEFERYPMRSLEMIELKRIPMSEREKNIILCHQEYYDGSGYPTGADGSTINKVIGLYNIICDYDRYHTFKDGFKGPTPLEAWKDIKANNLTPFGGHKYHPEVIKSLNDFFEIVVKRGEA